MELPATRRAQKELKKQKFSSFGKSEEYTVEADRMVPFENMSEFEPFVPKEEFSKIPFDPNIRHRLPTIPNHLVEKAFASHLPETPP